MRKGEVGQNEIFLAANKQFIMGQHFISMSSPSASATIKPPELEDNTMEERTYHECSESRD